MGFLGSFGKFLGGAVKIAGGFLVGGPAGAVATGLSLVQRGGPSITPTVPPFMGGGYASADSVIVRRGVFGNQTVGVYGPRIGAGISPWGGGGYPTDGGGGGTGLPAVMQVPSCPMPVGRGRVALMPSPCSGYHWNRGRYYVFGDCRTGSDAGVVEAGSRLVRNRRINPANAQAARRAARRLNSAIGLLRSIERTTARIVGRTARRGRSSCRGGCKGKCKCS